MPVVIHVTTAVRHSGDDLSRISLCPINQVISRSIALEIRPGDKHHDYYKDKRQPI